MCECYNDYQTIKKISISIECAIGEWIMMNKTLHYKIHIYSLNGEPDSFYILKSASIDPPKMHSEM